MSLEEEMRRFDAVSLFTGAMGLDLGLEQVGRLIDDLLGQVNARFTIRACVENDKATQGTIRKNVSAGRTSRGDIPVFGDIRQIPDPKSVVDRGGISGELDLLVGGPPCQSYSTAGRRGTIQDTRGSLMWEFVRFVRVLRPKFFLMENVRGLLSAAIKHRPIRERGPGHPRLSANEKPGSVLRLLLKDFEAEGYHVDVFEVNAVNYGAPQLRERLLFVGNKYNLITAFPEPTHGPKDDPQLTLSPQPRLIPYRTLGDAIGDLQEDSPVVMDFSPRKKKYLSMVPAGGNWRSLPPRVQKESMGKAWYAKGGRSGWWRRLSFDLPCPCLLTMPNHASTALCHPKEVRALSAREHARIQEFPDKWEVCGSPAERYRQLGNAVPLRLGEVSGKVIGDYLISLGNRSSVKPGQPVKPSRVVYIRSHVRTRHWYQHGKPVVRENADIY